MIKSIYPLITFQAILCLILLIACSSTPEQKDAESEMLKYDISSAISEESPSNFFSRPQEYLDWEAANTLRLVEEILKRFPPVPDENISRYSAFQMLDLVFHDVDAPGRRPVQEFHHRRITHALNEIQQTTVEEGALIWKLYNMGFLIRTKTVSFCFDLVRAAHVTSEGFAVSEEIMSSVIDQCDALFISHRHRDHADPWVARAFIDREKPVVAPPEIWQDEPIHLQITHLERSAHIIHTLPVQSGRQELSVVVYPGHQGTSIQNNVPLVMTPEGISVVHTGDQSNEDDFEWIDRVGETHHVDIYLPNTWTTDPRRAAGGYKPSLIIPGHENELQHSIDHREAYILNYRRWNVPYPVMMMTWGESYHYFPENFRRAEQE